MKVNDKINFKYIDIVSDGVGAKVENMRSYAGEVATIRNLTDDPLKGKSGANGPVSQNLVTIFTVTGGFKSFYDGRMLEVKPASFKERLLILARKIRNKIGV